MGDACVDVIGVGGVELVRVERAGGGNDEPACAADVAAAGRVWVRFGSDGEEDGRDGPLALDFGWLVLCAAS